MTDAKAINKSPELVRLAPLDLRPQLRCRLLPHPLECFEAILCERIDIGVVSDKARVPELRDQRLPETLNVHCRARREMFETAPQLRGARRILATPHDLSFG